MAPRNVLLSVGLIACVYMATRVTNMNMKQTLLMDEAAKMNFNITIEKYRECLDAILSGGDGVEQGCPFKEQGDKLLYIVIGDSTARKQAQAVDPDFPDFKFNGSLSEEEIRRLTKRTLTNTINGREVTTTIALEGTLRHANLHDHVLGKLARHTNEQGMEPTVVFFSGMALHECKNYFRNNDPAYLELLERKFGKDYEKTVQRHHQSAGVEEYLDIQEPCTMKFLKYYRVLYPNTLFIWRTLADPKVLFKGAPKYDTVDVEHCMKRSGQWEPINWPLCNMSYNSHQRIADTVKEFGYGILRDESIFPEKCGSFDGLHLGPECHKMFRDRVYKAALLPTPHPKTYLDVEEVMRAKGDDCDLEARMAAVRKIPELDEEGRGQVKEKINKMFTGMRRFNVPCGKKMQMLSYDPYTDEYFKPSEGELSKRPWL
eukprot:TRINITY_DN623_c2_g1_i1.p1 TRINITY_DN623_c2_g1~~TRINITY_DN623_c2_g1_i1.p1  ORF type:complete len:447 (+),score=190.63 TRINITY_DN623_c2_g1_i1:52-1341(+)